MAVLTASQAAEQISEYQKGMNASRYIPDLPDIFKAASEAARVYIFNVGPWTHVRELGSAGTYRMYACPEDKEYGPAIVIEGAEEEPYPKDEISCVMLPKAGKPRQLTGAGDGWRFAEQIIGIGPHVAANASFVPFGVFISKTEIPSKQDLAKAHAALNQKYVELVRYAMEAWARGPAASAEIMNQPDWYFKAARALNKSEQECPFLANSQTPVAREGCPGCGTTYEVGIALCGKCGTILDEDKYIAQEERKAAILAKVHAPKVPK